MSEPCRVITEEQYQDYLSSKEQLKEANEVIKEYADSDNWTRYYNEYSCIIKEDCVFYDSEGWKEAKDYLEKWGVK